MKHPAGPLPSFRVEGDLGPFQSFLANETLSPGLYLVTWKLSAAQPAVPPPLTLVFSQPAMDVQAVWSPANQKDRSLGPDWARGFLAKAENGAPVISLYNMEGTNRLTFACSELIYPVTMHAGVREEDAEIICKAGFFSENHPPVSAWEVKLLIDRREAPYYQCLDKVSRWWEAMPQALPSPVPETARQPMYSTWYSFHQRLDPKEVEEQCRLAKSLGCRAVIMDDGWQTADNSRGYAFCGDWEPAPQRIPDMKAHVDAVHKLGMKFMLWYALPLVGKNSRAFQVFKDKFLSFDKSLGMGMLDPRFPEVREHLIGIFEKAAREWGLDGLKLDFVDTFGNGPSGRGGTGYGRDLDSVEEAVDHLLGEIMRRLKAVNPDFLIEFRQPYAGPLMRKYGNMFRAGDCPYDSPGNRLRTLDLRLLCGNTAAHSDMLMWHENEPVEVAALQMLNVLFSVPQISVKLEKLPASHLKMLKFWLGFWRQNRDVLLDGELRPSNPELNYPLVQASTLAKSVIAFYDDKVARLEAKPAPELILVNATKQERVVLELKKEAGKRSVEVFNCAGRKISARRQEFKKGLHVLKVPPSGLIVCRGRK